METLYAQLQRVFNQAFQTLYPDLSVQTALSQASAPQFGHYQCNNAMRLAKPLKLPPQQIAQQVCAAVNAQLNFEQPNLIQKMEVAGPGFINIWLSPLLIGQQLDELFSTASLGIAPVRPRQKIVIDFSSPNTAKEMHVGHLRSTIIGDCLARIFELLDYEVLRLNHIGDWGTAFGMLIAYLKQYVKPAVADFEQIQLADLVMWYKAAKHRFDCDATFKKQAQLEVVALQGGDPLALQYWQLICKISARAYQQIYTTLDIKITNRGESFYQPMLAELVADLQQQGLIELSDGAKCLYLKGFNNREGAPLPFMVQKSDGGYNYATTDLAALRHRIDVEHASRLIYVTDAGQTTHFQMLFAAAEQAGYLDRRQVRCDHVAFGLVLRPDGKKFKTRSGDTERLSDLLTQAITQAEKILETRASPALSGPDKAKIAQALGLGAVKYADLSCHRVNDYVFSYERMLKFEGNTAAFLMYAYVRICSIKRKINHKPDDLSVVPLVLTHPGEIELAIQLRQFTEVLYAITEDLNPHRLCDYLYQLAEKFNAFFRDCRVAGVPEQNPRLKLCELTAQVLKTGFSTLGIPVIEHM